MPCYLIPINPCIVTLDGGQTAGSVWTSRLNEEWPEIEIKGLGFAGQLYYGCNDLMKAAL